MQESVVKFKATGLVELGGWALEPGPLGDGSSNSVQGILIPAPSPQIFYRNRGVHVCAHPPQMRPRQKLAGSIWVDVSKNNKQKQHNMALQQNIIREHLFTKFLIMFFATCFVVVLCLPAAHAGWIVFVHPSWCCLLRSWCSLAGFWARSFIFPWRCRMS